MINGELSNQCIRSHHLPFLQLSPKCLENWIQSQSSLWVPRCKILNWGLFCKSLSTKWNLCGFRSQTELRNYLTSPHSSFLWRLECVWQRTKGEEVDCHSKVTIVVAVKTGSFSNVESLVTCEQPWSWNKTLRKFECSPLRPLRCLESDPRLVVSTTTLSTKLSNI